jgi:hypothetical protein
MGKLIIRNEEPMVERLQVLNYCPGGPKFSKHRTVWRITISGLLCGESTLLALGYVFGDVDDHGWLFFVGGLLVGVAMGYILRGAHLPRRLAIPTAIAFYGVAGLIILIAVACLVTETNIITGAALKETDCLLPIVWLIGSVIPMTAGALLRLLAVPRSTA